MRLSYMLLRRLDSDCPPIMTRHSFLLILFLLLGAALRFHGLAPMDAMLHHDEAYNGLDALALVESPVLQAYFPANTGREGLFYYPLALGIALFGNSVFALRVVSAFIGIISLAAAYRLGHELFGRDSAVWVLAALAVLYWPVHLSHLIFRAGLVPLLGALSFAALLRAHRLQRGWWLAGVLTGLTLYTYTAARVYVAYALVWLLWCALRDLKARRDALAAIAIVLVMSLPLLIALRQPVDTTASIERAAAANLQTVVENTLDWGNALLGAGDPNDDHNLPDHPILDLPLATLALAGLLFGWRLLRQRWLGIWWLGLLGIALLPTILSIDAPHYLRGVGLLLPLALLIGTGAAWIARWRSGWLLALALVLWAGANTYTDFTRWLNTAELGIYIDERVNRAMSDVDALSFDTAPLVVPGFVYYPVIAYRAAEQEREVIFYEWPERDHTCFLTPNREALFLDLPIQLSNFERRAAPYLDLTLLTQQPDNDYALFAVQPRPALTRDWAAAAQVGSLLTMRAVLSLPETVERGETLAFDLAFRMQQSADREWRIFAHLQGDPTPYDGGTLWSDGDAPLCALASTEPQPDTTLVQQLTLPIPADLPADEYHIALGIYDPATGERLPLQTPSSETRYYEAARFSVE